MRYKLIFTPSKFFKLLSENTEKGKPIEQMFKLKLKKLTYATCDENLTRKFVETVYIRLLVEIFQIIHFLFIF